MELGQPFPKPYISSALHPGGWSPLYDKSPFIISATDSILDYMNEMRYPLASNVRILLKEAGAQIVNGVNIYIEFILGESRIKALVIDSASRHSGKNHRMTVEKIYITKA